MAYVLDKYPFTEAGKKLNLPEDIFNQCKLVYRLNKDLGLWIFEEFFSPDEEYDDEYDDEYDEEYDEEYDAEYDDEAEEKDEKEDKEEAEEKDEDDKEEE